MTDEKITHVIGLMSGTSLDGVDLALVRIDRNNSQLKFELIAFDTFSMSEALKAKIKDACDEGKSNNRLICSLNFELGDYFALSIIEFCRIHEFPLDQLDYIASHGQTIYHLPNPKSNEYASTLQIGEAAVIAYQTNTEVISNFRVMDMAAKGAGAPLVPYSEYILYAQEGKVRLMQNIGGIGNVTVVTDKLSDMIAFDTGPGNMMIDEAMIQLYGLLYDQNGEVASLGVVNDALFNHLEAHPYLEMLPPKSTGREAFGEAYTTELLQHYHHIKKEDIICTLTYFTAYTIAKSYQDFILNHYHVNEVIIGGGGAHNQTLIEMIRKLLPDMNVVTQEDIGYSSDAKEAMAFVVLADATKHWEPGNVIGATHALHPVILGQITPRPRRSLNESEKKSVDF